MYIQALAGSNGFFSFLNLSDGKGGKSNPATLVVLIALMIGVMYLTSIRPQRRRQKNEAAMRDNISVGDEITTIGGIMGRVVTVKEDSIIIETGADRTKLRLLRSAVGVNDTQKQKLQEEQEAAKKAQDEARAAKLGSGKAKKSKKSDD